VVLGDGVKPFGNLYKENNNNGPSDIAASITTYGKGKIAAAYLNLGERYLAAATSVARNFVHGLARELFPRPLVEVTGSMYVDLSVNRIGGKLAINLVNTAGPHADPHVYVYDEIPPVGPLEIRIRSGCTPKKVTLEPGGRELSYVTNGDAITLTLPRLEIHNVVVG